MPGRYTSTPRKEKREEGRKGKGSGHRVQYPTPSQATDALTGDKEQNGKQKRTKRKTWSGSPTHLPWTIQSPPTTRRDHAVSLFFLTPGPKGGSLLLLLRNSSTKQHSKALYRWGLEEEEKQENTEKYKRRECWV